MNSDTVTALDLAAVRDLVRPVEPVASVYLGLESATATVDRQEDLDLRWRAMAGRLLREGASLSTVEILREHLVSLPVYPTEVALFAADGRSLLTYEIPGGAPYDSAMFGAPARVLPLLAWLQARPAYVEVLIDRTGADLTAVPAGATSGYSRTVVGPDDEIERNAPGGWAQPRYQRRAEDSWRHNAGAVADAVGSALARVRADLLLVAGDIRAVQLLRERLPATHRLRVRLVPGGRGHDGSESIRRTAVATERAAHGAARSRSALAAFTDKSRGTAVQGVDDTLAALAEGRVATLLVADDPGDGRVAWFGPDVLCASDPRRFAGPDGVRPGRLVDIAIRAALLTDATVSIVDAGRMGTGWLSGVCRYS